MKIVAHTLLQNEENFVWYAINSVIDYVDEILVWDTGSVDHTVEIVKSINNPKIKFKEIGNINPYELTHARNAMLQETNADWIFILDGDEIWHKEMVENQIKELSTIDKKYEVVVTPNIMLAGDMYHYLPESKGEYRIHGRKGHFNIRFIKNTPGLSVQGKYPYEAYVNGNGIKVQDLLADNVYFSKYFYLHASFLPRSSKDKKKIKYEIAKEFPLDYFYPETFFVNELNPQNNIWLPASLEYKVKAYMQAPFKWLKRRLK